MSMHGARMQQFYEGMVLKDPSLELLIPENSGGFEFEIRNESLEKPPCFLEVF